MNDLDKSSKMFLTQGLKGLLYSRKGTLCIFVALLASFLILVLSFCSHFNPSVCMAGFSMFGVIGSVISAIFCNGNTKEAIANANNQGVGSLMNPTPPTNASLSTSTLVGANLIEERHKV